MRAVAHSSYDVLMHAFLATRVSGHSLYFAIVVASIAFMVAVAVAGGVIATLTFHELRAKETEDIHSEFISLAADRVTDVQRSFSELELGTPGASPRASLHQSPVYSVPPLSRLMA